MEITDIGSEGEGVGRAGGFAFFVGGALPGDNADVRVTEVKKSFGRGRIHRLVSPSPDRVTPRCRVAGQCGGCPLQGLSYEAQLTLKTKRVKDALERIGGFENPPIRDIIGMEDPWRYRNKGRFAAADGNGGLVFGFYSHKTRDVIAVSDCPIQSAVCAPTLQAVREYANENGVSVYDERSRKGLLRGVIVRHSQATGDAMACVIINGGELPREDILTDKLLKVSGVKTAAAVVSVNESTAEAFGTPRVIFGGGRVTDKLGAFTFDISPLSFFQTNTAQTRVLYGHAADFAGLAGAETVADAYCGTGAISIFMADKAAKIYGFEIDAASVADAVENARQNGVTNAEFIEGDAETRLPEALDSGVLKPDVIVLDPPRKGCGAGLLQAIADSSAGRVVYVSCSPATLARDLKALGQGGFALAAAQPVDMFPHTAHIETAVLMTRNT